MHCISKGRQAFPGDLEAWLCSRTQIADMTRQMMDIGVDYIGLCCGNRSAYMRTVAETVGRRPPASHYAPDMSQHFSRLADGEHKWNKEKHWKNFAKNLNEEEQQFK